MGCRNYQLLYIVINVFQLSVQNIAIIIKLFKNVQNVERTIKWTNLPRHSNFANLC